MAGWNLDHRRKDILSCVLEFVDWAVASGPAPLVLLVPGAFEFLL